MTVICAWCKEIIGESDGEGETHGICPTCYDKEIAKLREKEKT